MRPEHQQEITDLKTALAVVRRERDRLKRERDAEAATRVGIAVEYAQTARELTQVTRDWEAERQRFAEELAVRDAQIASLRDRLYGALPHPSHEVTP